MIRNETAYQEASTVFMTSRTGSLNIERGSMFMSPRFPATNEMNILPSRSNGLLRSWTLSNVRLHTKVEIQPPCDMALS